ncbi:MAG: ABC transporter permease [Candidatus Cloacimonas sp.]|jgi:ABC-type antimicrobial peptide transport system permease subunit|nr:ABC transporter permease [Candidatus Cloacimonadota bacterium]
MALSLKESITVGITDFWTRKVRSIITIFSVVLGIMSIIVVQSLAKGIQESTLGWMMERGGMQRINVDVDWRHPNPKNLPSYLTYREYEYFRSMIPEADYVTPQIMSWGRLSAGKNQMRAGVSGVIPEFPKIEDWQVVEGRFITETDMDNANDVIVIGSTIREELFGNKVAVGQYITYNERRFMVIGVLEKRVFESKANLVGQGDNMLEYLNMRAYMPISTIIRKTSTADEIRIITIRAKELKDTPVLRQKVEDILRNMRQGETLFNVTSAQESADDMAEGTQAFQIVFFVVSAISLLVGGIVIMNIMMASVQERTREIGIRMAVGASKFDIFIQFVVQTVIITFLGGMLGVVVGLSLLNLISGYIGIKMVGGITMVVVSLGISIVVGILFGTYPAVKASNLDPVKCLAYE